MDRISNDANEEVKELNDRIAYLEEVVAAQRSMLKDSITYIQKLEQEKIKQTPAD